MCKILLLSPVVCCLRDNEHMIICCFWMRPSSPVQQHTRHLWSAQLGCLSLLHRVWKRIPTITPTLSLSVCVCVCAFALLEQGIRRQCGHRLQEIARGTSVEQVCQQFMSVVPPSCCCHKYTHQPMYVVYVQTAAVLLSTAVLLRCLQHSSVA